MLVTKASQRPMGSKVKKGLQTDGRTNDDQKSSLFLRFRLADKKKPLPLPLPPHQNDP